MGSTASNRQAHIQGVVYVEFLLTAIPLLVLFLCLVQLGLVAAGRVLTGHAAGKASRAAIVILPDDTREYEGVPVNTVGKGAGGLDGYREAPAKGRYNIIRNAARYTMAPLSPELRNIGESSVRAAIGTGSFVDSLFGLYTWTAVAVGLGFIDGDNNYLTTFGPTDMINVKVLYLFRCAVPVASSLLCSNYLDLPSDKRELLEANGATVPLAGTLSAWKFKILSATRTLPNQGRR